MTICRHCASVGGRAGVGRLEAGASGDAACGEPRLRSAFAVPREAMGTLFRLGTDYSVRRFFVL